MIDIINEISSFIDTWAKDIETSPSPKVKTWGFVELTHREANSKAKKTVTSQPIPMTINGTGERKQISLDDKFDFISWIRWISPVQTRISEEDTWGIKEGKRKSLPLRIVIAHKVELGEELIDELTSALPDNLYINGYDFVFLQDYSIDPDQETNYNIELGETAYEKHRFNWNVYVINIYVEYIIGKKCIPAGEGFEYTLDFPL